MQSVEAPLASRPIYGGRVARVHDPTCGLQPGDLVIAANGFVLRDLIDLGFALAEGECELSVERDGAMLAIQARGGAGAGLPVEFEEAVFAGIRECNNHCEFCFIRGLPRGLRPSLYVFDDDYRYSFLFGNFLTLTNLDERDWERIGFQRLSPLWVSVHATDPVVRNRMLGNRHAPPIVPQLQRLGGLGVEVHAQIVLCPGINDGHVLDETVGALADLWPTVQDVAVVPVGLTRYSRVRNIRLNTSVEARAAVGLIERWQRRLRPRLGKGFVYGSDELYLLAGAPLPAARRYDGYPHLHNGVGLTRFLLGEWARRRSRVPEALGEPRRVAWICGRAAAGALERIAAELRAVRNLSLEVRVVENRFFGGTIGVSGLLAGRDLLEAVRELEADRIVLPRAAFDSGGERTLDEITLGEIAQAARGEVILGRGVDDLLRSVLEE